MKKQSISGIVGDSASAPPGPRAQTRRPTAQGWLQVVEIWIQRSRERRALAKLDDRLLHDIGISRADAAREIAKPFWR